MVWPIMEGTGLATESRPRQELSQPREEAARAILRWVARHFLASRLSAHLSAKPRFDTSMLLNNSSYRALHPREVIASRPTVWVSSFCAAFAIISARSRPISPIFPSYRIPTGMAWFYNPILPRFFEIGLVATSPRHYSPAATMDRKFAFFQRNSQISKIARRKICQKRQFAMACSTRPIFAVFFENGRQIGRF